MLYVFMPDNVDFNAMPAHNGTAFPLYQLANLVIFVVIFDKSAPKLFISLKKCTQQSHLSLFAPLLQKLSEKKCREIWECVEFAIKTNVVGAKFDSVFYGIFAFMVNEFVK